MDPERIVKIEDAIRTLDAAGQPITTHAVHELSGGSYPALVAYMRERREEGGVAVLEEDDEADLSPAAALAQLDARIAAADADYERWSARYTHLWQARKAGKLERDGYIDYLVAEDKMGLLLHELDAMRAQRRTAEAHAQIAHAQAHHDAHCAEVDAAQAAVAQAIDALFEACAAFVAARNDQIDPLVTLTRADGQPAFELRDGMTQLQDMFSQLPGTSGTVQAWLVGSLLRPHAKAADGRPVVGLSVGDTRTLRAHATGAQPFPATLVRNYLASYRALLPQPETEMENL